MTWRASWIVALAAAGALGGAVVVGLGIQLREPDVHDEFAHLLAADTYAAGRLANPTPPHWVHFETFHVLVRPTRASKYPPGPGLALAAGQRLAGHPLVGTWLANAAFAAALAWMAWAWLPPPWAAAAALLGVLHLGAAGPWAQSYWSGALAAAGGALLFGGLRRWGTHPRVGTGLALGAGLGVLALSRPFEGALASLPAAGMLVARSLGGPSWRPLLAPAAAGAAVLAAARAFLAVSNRAVTGDPLRLPYALHAEQYAFVPLFLWGELGEPPVYHHEMIERMHRQWDLRWWTLQQSPGDRLRLVPAKWLPAWQGLFSLSGTLALLGLFLAGRDVWTWLALGTTAGVALVMLFGTTFGGYPHYLAPVAALALVLQAQGLSGLAGRGRTGRLAAAFVLGLAAGELALRIADHPVDADHWSRRRASLERELAARPGPDLVLVEYGRAHTFHQEWVYNRADLVGAPVVWARAMDPERDRALLAAFPSRRAWLLEVDRRPGSQRLRPHPLAGPGASTGSARQ